MSGSYVKKTRRVLIRSLVLLALALWLPRAHAYQTYDDGEGNGCVQCHNNSSAGGGFTGGSSIGQLHLKHVNSFGITDCGLCHSASSGGQLPVLTYSSGQGYGCAGCHGVDYGETSILSGEPKATAYGLRLVHASEGVSVCASCHFPGSDVTGDPDPAPEILPETEQPPYYLLSNNDLTDPCSAEQEGFDGTRGLDNDGNGLRDADDPACQDRPVTPTPKPIATPTPVRPTPIPTSGGGLDKITVYPGQSIQAAVDAVAPGGTVYVSPGTYEEVHDRANAVTVSKSGVRLIAKSTKDKKVILKPHGGQKNGIVAEPAAEGERIDGFAVQGFTVQGFPSNGIVTKYVDDFKIVKNESIDNKHNGIWPTLSAKGLVSKNVSYGSDDSALWVETSVNVRVLDNVLHTSVTGLEVSNSDDILLSGNEAYNNSVGIGLYMQPGLPRKESNRWTVEDNYTHDNNRENTAPVGSMAGDLPIGGGILFLGPDNSVLRNNRIENNGFYGIGVIDYCIGVAGSAFDCTENPPDFDPSPDHNRFEGNTLVDNGTDPPDHPAKDLASDIVVLGGTDNCFEDNVYDTSDPDDLPGCNDELRLKPKKLPELRPRFR